MYLKARHLLRNKTIENIELAIRCFKDSISYDPQNVLSYIGIGEGYSWLHTFEFISYGEAYAQITEFISRASKINPEIPELYVLKGDAARNLEWAFGKSEEFYLRAIALNPNHADAHRAYANLLAQNGKFSEALSILTALRKLDPISTVHNITAGRLFYNCGYQEQALSEFEEALELEPRNYIAFALMGCALS